MVLRGFRNRFQSRQKRWRNLLQESFWEGGKEYSEQQSERRKTMAMVQLLVVLLMRTLMMTIATGDFRHISYEDLVEKSSLFHDDGVTTYSQLLFDVARQQVVVGAR
ncbi:hypothetical protein PV327_002890 [Microctonus hyperodae]|uniref:Uncharacterized protein n=1 Tax=Microctonus hyperodae TaxID=165561 RepID=A0AA39FGY5_MICHY|nr:hypothetical protein PV327_002890 [Microctonus hyperodae]